MDNGQWKMEYGAVQNLKARVYFLGFVGKQEYDSTLLYICI